MQHCLIDYCCCKLWSIGKLRHVNESFVWKNLGISINHISSTYSKHVGLLIMCSSLSIDWLESYTCSENATFFNVHSEAQMMFRNKFVFLRYYIWSFEKAIHLFHLNLSFCVDTQWWKSINNVACMRSNDVIEVVFAPLKEWSSCTSVIWYSDSWIIFCNYCAEFVLIMFH